MKLHELRDNPAATKRRKRVGRGPGSGVGKTAGRGMNGQNSRSGTALGAFEGGQMPIYQRLPKRGFNNKRRKKYSLVNLGQLQRFIDAGKLNPGLLIDDRVMVECGIVRRPRDGVRLLAKGTITSQVRLKVTGASAAALRAVEEAGGSVETDRTT